VADFFIPDVSCCRELHRSSSADDWLIIGCSILTNLSCIYTTLRDPTFTKFLLAGGPLLQKIIGCWGNRYTPVRVWEGLQLHRIVPEGVT
jgi:hypothetical protein